VKIASATTEESESFR